MLHVGICLPKSCTNDDVNRLVDKMLNSRIFGEKYFLNENFSIVESKTIKLRDNFFGTTMVNIFLYDFYHINYAYFIIWAICNKY